MHLLRRIEVDIVVLTRRIRGCAARVEIIRGAVVLIREVEGVAIEAGVSYIGISFTLCF